MQNFTPISSSQSVLSSLALLLDNDRTAMSLNAGTAFPTENLFVGMLCLRTDTMALHALKSLGVNGAEWVLVSASGANEPDEPDGNVGIDDEAGAGVTDKTWSANKLTSEFDDVREENVHIDDTAGDGATNETWSANKLFTVIAEIRNYIETALVHGGIPYSPPPWHAANMKFPNFGEG